MGGTFIPNGVCPTVFVFAAHALARAPVIQ
jgi:hypothetical protein